MKNRVRQLAVASALALSGISLAHAGFIGRELSVGYFYPDLSTSYGPAIETPPIFTFGAGNEAVVSVEQGVTWITVDVSDTSILSDFSTTLEAPKWNAVAFSGLVFNLVSGGPFALSAARLGRSRQLAARHATRPVQ